MSDTDTTLLAGGQDPEPAVEPTQPAPEAQPDPASEGGTEAQPQGGQDLIAPYLEGVDPTHLDVVKERLEQYRKDADANVTREFQKRDEQIEAYRQFAEDPSQLEVPVALYENLMERPLETIQWVIDRMETEGGLDLKAQLLEALNKPQTAEEPKGEPASDPNDPNRPLTVKEWQDLQAQQQQQEEARVKTDTWLSEAAKAHGLELGDGDAVLKQAILQQAAAIMPQFKAHGQDAGKQAIATAVETISKRFRPASAPKQDPQAEPTPAPKVAQGGSAPSPAKPDFSGDSKQRREAMLSMLTNKGTTS